ncbi:X-ray radiation resistance-associated protein 1 [Electrophorus electricus]|uniref:X-ray radiation resistance-associated protein 1 n=1 Tax=Electrophorus electricus TaxID=8005 RepID=UPI0015CFFE13|nr:X-ray radiation resistance-associated protein 1 [Electrophorus electricus]
MAGLGVYKLDNGESLHSNCFPVRSFFPQSQEGAGHWLVTHRRIVEERYRAQKNKKSGQRFRTGPSVQSNSEKHELRGSKSAGNTLNGQLLMELHCVDKPSDLCSVDISERKLQLIKLEGLEEFESVAYINASDNSLTLDPFCRFPSLRELDLSLNGLCILEVHAEGFPRLEVLDLSYNGLSSDGILCVGLLPRLKVLHLTGNNLKMLPPNMAGPYAPPDEVAPHSSSLFEALEVLMLDDNKLTSPGVFSSLVKLKRLQHLNLQGNHISEVPYLHMPPIQVPATSVLMTEGTKEHVMKMDCFSDFQEDQKKFITRTSNGLVEYSEDFYPPVPQLQYLNLASNEIAEEEALLAVALFPMLRELVIHSNPLTLQRSGNPPMLTWFLQDMLGINIRGKKTAEKVKTKIPKVPLITTALCISETSCTERGNKNNSPLPSECKSTDVLLPGPSQTSTERKEDLATARGAEHLEGEITEIPRDTHQTEEPFFVTEVNNLLEPKSQEKAEKTEEITQFLKKDTECTGKLIGYEALLDNLDMDMPRHVGIQHTVKVLEHTLKNLLVYRDSKANLDHLQRPYREQQKRIRDLPPVPCKVKEEKVKEILTEMKEMRTIHEVPLDKILKSKDVYRKEYEEALKLLKDMKMKYKTIHLKAVEQAAQIESDYY